MAHFFKKKESRKISRPVQKSPPKASAIVDRVKKGIELVPLDDKHLRYHWSVNIKLIIIKRL